MNTSISERRIRNNRRRRMRQMRRNIMMLALTFVLVLAFSSLFFSFRSKAQGSDEEILYKYYKSVTVEDGDTLWEYAKEFADSQHYKNYDAYIQEVIQMNFLENDGITTGQHLILPYYSPDFV